MNGFGRSEDDASTTFLDLVFNMMAIFLVVVVLMLPFINDPAKKAEGEIATPGDVLIEASWPDGVDADVDLWVRAAGEKPVGYSNRASKTFNLLRDDLGNLQDPTKINHEFVFSRGMPQGEVVVNLHGYRFSVSPVIVQVTVTVKYEGRVTALVSKSVELHQGQEATAFRFSLKDGQAIDVHDTFMPLRSGSF